MGSRRHSGTGGPAGHVRTGARGDTASYRRLVGQLTGVTGDPVEAEDVVMEAFARAVAKSRTFAAVDNPEAWLRTVAVNIARSRWRRVTRLRVLSPSTRGPVVVRRPVRRPARAAGRPARAADRTA